MCARAAGGRPFGDVIILDTPYEGQGLTKVTDVGELMAQLGVAAPPRPVGAEAIAQQAVAAKVVCDSLSALIERRLYELAPDPWTSREPLVTVRIATWKGHETLVGRTIPSVLAGTYQNVEVVVCSDGPDPEARAAVEGIVDPRVRYVELPERPVYPAQPWSFWQTAGIYAMNRVSAEGRGSFVAPLDHDDAFTKDHIEVLLRTAADSEADFIYGQALMQDPDGGWRTIGSEPLQVGQVTHGAIMFSSRLKHVGYPTAGCRAQPGDWNMTRLRRNRGVGWVSRRTWCSPISWSAAQSRNTATRSRPAVSGSARRRTSRPTWSAPGRNGCSTSHQCPLAANPASRRSRAGSAPGARRCGPGARARVPRTPRSARSAGSDNSRSIVPLRPAGSS